MKLREKIKNWNKKRKYKQAMRRMGNQNVRRTKILYPLVVYGSIAGLIYGISCIWTSYPWWPSLFPIYLMVAIFLISLIRKNWRMTWIYISNYDRGRLLHVLNEYTQWSYEHKMKVIKWVYPGHKAIRNEVFLKLGEKVRNGVELDKTEKRQMNYKVVNCPQQITDGFNKALLINNLIYAHRNIRVLDQELRDILELTNENMLKFNLQEEVAKVKGDEQKEEIERLTEIGKRNAKNNE